MRHTTRTWRVLGCGLAAAAVLWWTPTAMAGGENPAAEGPSDPLTLQNKLHFGPEVYAVERSTSASGQRLHLKLDDGTTFTYLEGREISLKIGGEKLKIEIQEHEVRVGKNHWCSSADTACIVHAIRKQLKGLTRDHSAHGLAALQHTLRSMRFGGPIGHVFHGLVTMPVAQDGTREDNHGNHGDH